MLHRIGFPRHVRVMTRRALSAETSVTVAPSPPSVPSTAPNNTCASNCSYVADQLLLRISLTEAPASIRLIRLLMTNPSNANSVLLKRLTSSKRDLRWYNVWLRDIFIGAEGINTVPTVPVDSVNQKAAYDALVRALMMTTKYEQSSLLTGTGAAAESITAARRKSVEETIAKFFNLIPHSVSLEIAGYVEDFALEKYRAEKLRNNLKKCCRVHTRALEPVLTHLGISIDGYTVAKIAAGQKAMKNAHNAIFCELMEMMKRAEEYRVEHFHAIGMQHQQHGQQGEGEAATMALDRDIDSAEGRAVKTSKGGPDVAKKASKKSARVSAARNFTARHCLKIGIRCVDIRTDGNSRGARGDITDVRRQAAAAAIAEMVQSYGSEIHPSAAHLAHADAVIESSSQSQAAAETTNAAPFMWNTGEFERYTHTAATNEALAGAGAAAVAGVSVMPASRVFRDKYLNIPARKLRSQYILSTIPDLDDKTSASTPAGATAAPQDRGKNKVLLQNLPADITAEELALVLKSFGRVKSVEIFCGDNEGSYAQSPSSDYTFLPVGRPRSSLWQGSLAPSPLILTEDAEEEEEAETETEVGGGAREQEGEEEEEEGFDTDENILLETEGGSCILRPRHEHGRGHYDSLGLFSSQDDDADAPISDMLDQNVRGVNPVLHEYLLTRSEDVDSNNSSINSDSNSISSGSSDIHKNGIGDMGTSALRLTSSPRNPIATFSSMVMGSPATAPVTDVSSQQDERLDQKTSSNKKTKKDKDKDKDKDKKEKDLRPSKMLTQKLVTDTVAFVTMEQSSGLNALLSEEVKILGISVREHPVRVREAQEQKVLIVEILNNLVVKRIIEVLSSIMGGWYEFLLMDSLEEYSKPVFVHLSFSSHSAACVAYDKITAMMDISPNFPVKVHWHKTAWYYQVAAKAKQMEYNAKLLAESDSTGRRNN